ncbi:sugar phosphate isomerase/epimerase [Catenibacillus scindens]|uniref:C-deglycosylation enzyme beta subunit n=1 Tax=Catenibacillus scindens TaxID=673271 RepID=A0A7W8HAW7_9FIRM|nr:DUF6379 domain-containing protein [Catenibacillus scindens]MBB5264633.1 sugar phosphate isomerase/epimerase [Catenibacillus scindens]
MEHVMEEHNIKRAVTIYSWHRQVEAGLLTWDDCVKAAVKMGCNGIELLGQLYFRYCPEALQEDIDAWEAMMWKYGTKMICHDFFVDMTMYAHRRLTVKEGVDIIRRHALFAKKLHCPIIRLGGTALPEITKAAIPVLEDIGVKMGQELHNGASSFAMPWTQELLDVIAQSGSKYVGIIPDMSMFTKHIGQRNINAGIAQGVDEKLAYEVADMFEKVSNEDFRKYCSEQIERADNNATKDWLSMIYRMEYFDPSILKELAPYIVHCHGKFYEMDDNNEETTIDYPGIIKALVEGGYNGYISAEYEGSPINNDTFEPFRRYQKMLDKYLGKYPDANYPEWPNAQPMGGGGFFTPNQQAIEGTLANWYDDGECTGFCVDVRSYYYRGVPLALFESAYVNVDGEVYGPDSMRVLVDGEMFEFKDMCDVTLHYWNKGYPAKLIIRKPGGLSKGVHDISAIAEIRAYYMREGFAPRRRSVTFAPAVKMEVNN